MDCNLSSCSCYVGSKSNGHNGRPTKPGSVHGLVIRNLDVTRPQTKPAHQNFSSSPSGFQDLLVTGCSKFQGLQSLPVPPELFKGSGGSQGFKSPSPGRKMGDRMFFGQDAGSGDLFDVVLLDVDHPMIERSHMRIGLAESGLILLSEAVSLIAHVQAVREKLLPWILLQLLGVLFLLVGASPDPAAGTEVEELAPDCDSSGDRESSHSCAVIGTPSNGSGADQGHQSCSWAPEPSKDSKAFQALRSCSRAPEEARA
uniref:Uncharacterized protein n=1 Tax=Oryza rufipogon TaxID=4529 RepID=A0A0E0PQR5_ORYRU